MKPLASLWTPSITYRGGTIEASYMARDIKVYSRETAVILIGTVEKVGEPYLLSPGHFTSQQNITLKVDEFVKTDPDVPNMASQKNMTILIEGGLVVRKNDRGKVCSFCWFLW